MVKCPKCGHKFPAPPEKLKCKRCDHKWTPRSTTEPEICPKCKSPYWNKIRTRIIKKKGND